MADRIGTQVGNYRLTALLGQGGFAEVYLGEQVHLGTQAAIKLLHAPLAQALPTRCATRWFVLYYLYAQE
jgi:serine/threonine-protein kinase